MEGHEYTLIQRAREQNKERKKIAKELQRLNSNLSENEPNTLSAQDSAVHQFDDYRGLESTLEIEEKKANLEARHQELLVHVPIQMNTTVQNAGSKLHGAKQQFFDQQQLYLKKKKLRLVIVFLNGALLFGNQFVGNGPAPLQTEIQQHMKISDAQFNMYFSAKFLASLIPPLVLAVVMDRFTLRSLLLTISFCCVLGQMFFAIGLQDKDHYLCVLGRFLIGISDALTIFQQSLMCVWFPASQLPFAFGILLFLMKIVRTTNDNVASMFYEATAGQLEPGQVSASSLVMYQWIGFAVCILSLFCSLLLAQIHESVIDNSSHNEVKEKSKELKRQNKQGNAAGNEDTDDDQLSQGKDATFRQLLTRPIVLYMMINAFGYASIHAFYPNLSKFFQTKFNYSNIEAGHVSSLPYLIASFTVPFLGSLTGYLGQQYFELMLFASIAMIILVHMSYLSISDYPKADETTEEANESWMPVLPLFLFGLGHALFTTMQAPTVPKLVKNETHLSRIFTYVKITESLGITVFVYLAGYIKTHTGSFTGVSLMMLVCASVALLCTFWLMQETKAIGGHMFDSNTYRETYVCLKSYAQKFFRQMPLDKDGVTKSQQGKPKLHGKDGSSDSDNTPEKSKNLGKRMQDDTSLKV